MPIPEFIASLRAKVGNHVLLVPTVVVMARDATGRLLLVQEHETGLWGCPGGIIEPNEVPADAAVRETWEEAGILVELTRLLGVFGGDGCCTRYRNGDELAWVATVFGARAVGGVPSSDGAETRDARFFTTGEISALPISADARLFLQATATANGDAYFKPATWRPERDRTREGGRA